MKEREELQRLFEKYCRKLRITPAWDVELRLVEDRALSYGRCGRERSFNELYDGLNDID